MLEAEGGKRTGQDTPRREQESVEGRKAQRWKRLWKKGEEREDETMSQREKIEKESSSVTERIGTNRLPIQYGNRVSEKKGKRWQKRGIYAIARREKRSHASASISTEPT